MPCTAFTTGRHLSGFVCGRGVKAPTRCTADGCRRAAQMLCDVPLDTGGTCDAPICPVHAWHEGVDRHRCPEHSQTYGYDYRIECLARGIAEGAWGLFRSERAAGRSGAAAAQEYFEKRTKNFQPDFQSELRERARRIWKQLQESQR